MNPLAQSPKKRATRYKVAKAGTIKFGDTSVDCLIQNLSETGAGMDVVNHRFEVPSRFELTIPSDGLCQPCRVVWRKDHRIGVAFIFSQQAIL
jgi:hypothetical protein